MKTGTVVSQKGFTLIEVVITIVIVAIGVALAVPSWDSMVQKRRVTSGAEEVASFLQYAQSEAIKSAEEVTVTVKRNGAGTNWCVGAIDNTAKAARGLDHCECDVADTNNARCTIDDSIAKISSGSFSKFSMDSTQVQTTDSNDYHFDFDPVRGLKMDGANINSNVHKMTMLTDNAKYKLQVDISVTGRVRICNPVTAKKVPGFDVCGGFIVVVPPVVIP